MYGTHDAILHEMKLGALLKKEHNKPPEQRDDELMYALRVEYRRTQLCNEEIRARTVALNASVFEKPAARQCCAAVGWVRQRLAASYRAQHAYTCQYI